MKNRLQDWSRGKKIWTGVGIAACLLLVVGFWYIVGYYQDSWNSMVRAITRGFLVRDMFPTFNPAHWTPFTYIILALAVAGLSYFAFKQRGEVKLDKYGSVVTDEEEKADVEYRAAWTGRDTAYDAPKPRVVKTERRWLPAPKKKVCTRLIPILAMFTLLLGYSFTGLWNNDKDGARSYADGTTFVVENPDKISASLASLTQGASRNPDGAKCLFTTKHDVPSCITQGKLSANWENRSAPLSGAEIVMSRTSGSVPNTEILTKTLTYLNDSSSWTAIRNGKNKVPLYGIVSYDGTNAAQTCRFTGKYALNYAFGGNWGQNLNDTLAKDYPGLLFSNDDAWGYCKGPGEITSREPVIVIPVAEQESYGRRTTLRSSGVLDITGSPSGEPVIVHHKSIQAGVYPGPVYAISLVAQMREMTKWASGRGNKNRLKFGYEPSTVAAQDDADANDSEYLLRDKNTGRLFWVTPLKPRSTDSQLLVAYSLTPADEATAGTLNEQKVYVLPDDDPRIVNVDDMQARVSESIRNSNPGFFTGKDPGKVSEFLPINDTTWQAFAVLGGRVVFQVLIPSNARISPTVQKLDGSAVTPGTPAVSPCTKPETELEKQQLADCITRFAHELAGRN